MEKIINPSRIMIAATASGAGKTTITTGLLSLLKEKKYDVHAFKCGPDYIDPMYHEKILKIESKNLDPFFCDSELLKASFMDGAGEINIIEACMGLYDGLGVSSECSSYSVAKILDCPIILVINGHGMGASILAIIKGFLEMDEAKLIKGVFLNHVSEGYYNKLRTVIEEDCGIACVGYLPKQKDSLESRHLGLKLPDEENGLNIISAISGVMEKGVDLFHILDIAKKAPKLLCKKNLKDYITVDLSDKVIAVARDEAFNFYYKDNISALKLAGATVKYFSPLSDKRLPENTNAIYLGGGYPELYLKELEENVEMKSAIKAAINMGMPSFAECGGFMYLQHSIEGSEMVGIFSGTAVNQNRLVRFGYVEGRFKDYQLKGHEFHHFDVEKPGDAFDMKKVSTQAEYKAECCYKRLIAGFPHFYFFSDPDFLKEFK